MTTLRDFLHDRFARGGFTTEDALACFLPLLRQVAAAHRAGKVAPLQGINDLRVEADLISFDESNVREPVLQVQRIRELEVQPSKAVNVVGESRVVVDVDAGTGNVTSLQIGQPGQELTRPVYLPEYVSWEHELGHHDPLTDVFVLGLILGSLLTGLDLNEPEKLAHFVKHRPNLFEIVPQVNPVIAKAVVRMTELARQRRPQDVAGLLHTLENYRDQEVDFDFDLARLGDLQKRDPKGRREVILTRLQQRLFEISRRNRLLQFRATMQTLNLTLASVPLSFHVQSIRPDQILTWSEGFQKAVSAGKSISLAKYLRFEEAIYLPCQLDQIRSEARRDEAEFGFAQLRLVVCFLRWTNLKETPPDRFDSPLVLLPVKLTKAKGVRDAYSLEPVSTEAEINPVVRHCFKQFYAIDLPEHIDLSETNVDTLHEFLSSKIQATEPGVTIEKIDRPRIQIIHAKAQRRLELYRRRAGLTADEAPKAPQEAPVDEPSKAPEEASIAVEKEQTVYTLADEQKNPYQWEFDLCSVTLGNFHYRKMSLVRDYSTLLENGLTHRGFETIFSLAPRPLLDGETQPLPLEQSFAIVPCDPTQAAAIALARTGRDFIIQGPPGTGKSQTITNLIADYIANGKRVLFVCEKRAAIDVVYHRLDQIGLRPLCCLIHDSQADKKAFILDLKQTYEDFLAEAERRAASAEKERSKLIGGVTQDLQPLQRFDEAMRATPPAAGIPLRALLERALELKPSLPELTARELEQTPLYSLWAQQRDRITRLIANLAECQDEVNLAKHPLRLLNPSIAAAERPLEATSKFLDSSRKQLNQLSGQLRGADPTIAESATFQQLLDIAAFAVTLRPLADKSQLGLLQSTSAISSKFDEIQRHYQEKAGAVERAMKDTTHWRQKLSPSETQIALEQARELEGKFLSFFRPSWWRLRSLLYRSFDVWGPVLKPTWRQMLEPLQVEHLARAALQEVEEKARIQFAFAGSFGDFSKLRTDLLAKLNQQAAHVKEFVARQLESKNGDQTARQLAGAQSQLVQFSQELPNLLAAGRECKLSELGAELERVETALGQLPDFLPCLTELAGLPSEFASTLRHWPHGFPSLEAAMARRSIAEILIHDRPLARFTADARAETVSRIEKVHDQLHETNAGAVRERVRSRFLENVRATSSPQPQATAAPKEFKAEYNRGRKELEHEFGKVMRYRSIRDLADDETGLVIRDLKPVWLMSPLSVSDTLPLNPDFFDVVIFDEASQITLEAAVPSLHRAKQIIVVGDEMQLPPTSFFATKQNDEDEAATEEGAEASYDLSSNSFLNHAARNLPGTMLGWHYRSRSESLISYSNAAFYQGRLLTVPEAALPPPQLEALTAEAADQGDTNAERLLERPVSSHFMIRGMYEQRRNLAEADYIAHLVRGLFAATSKPTIGIVAFSEAQQGEIQEALDRLGRADTEFQERLETEYEREMDGQFVGLLVKNLENMQGDERDVVILSVCYGPGPNGKMLMNFGPINQSGGERRLNVAFSRAKKHMAIVSSIRAEAITNDYNAGARCLKNYLRYAEACSVANRAAALRVLREMHAREDRVDEEPPKDIVVTELAAELRQCGYHVDLSVGQSSLRCDLAIRKEGDPKYRAGILVDTSAYYQQRNLLEREVLRPRLLRGFGWKVIHVLTKEWHDDRTAVVAGIEKAVEDTNPKS